MILDTNELIGKALGTCTLRRLIGRGGMGAVYLAQQTRPRRTVAVKVLLPHTIMDKRPRDEFLARFRREADAIAALDHINILPLYEYGEQEDMAYLVMPFVTGGTLREMLEKRGPLPLEETVRIVEQAADALDTAHAQGIIHRDLKPANILFHADGRALLADFGLAKVVRDLRESGIKGRSSQEGLTSAGTIVGTPEYLSPEQGTGKPVDHHTDIYSLGVMLYQMLAGQVPFTGASPVAIAIKHTLEAPPSLTKLNPLITPEIEAIVMKALAKTPEQRYHSAGELARALKAMLDIPATPADTPRGSKIADVQTILFTPSDKSEPESPVQPGNQQLILEHDAHTQLEDKPTNIYSGSTEEAPRVVAQVEAKRDEPAPPRPANIEVSPPTQPAIMHEQRAAISPQHGPATGARVPVSPPTAPLQSPAASWQPTPPPGPRTRRQAPALAVLGAIVVLLLIVGSFATYRYIANQGNGQTNTPQTTPTVGQGNKTTPEATVTVKPPNLPGAKIPAGSRIYGTNLPGECDKLGGTWQAKNVKVTCHENNVELSSSGGNGVLLLTGLPQNQGLPNNYIIQVETVQTNGDYGLVYRSLPDSGTTNVLILSSGNWHSDDFNASWNAQNQLASGTGPGTASGKHTINIKVQNTNYEYDVDGNYWGSANNGVEAKTAIGIFVPAGSRITITNFQIFSL